MSGFSKRRWCISEYRGKRLDPSVRWDDNIQDISTQKDVGFLETPLVYLGTPR